MGCQIKRNCVTVGKVCFCVSVLLLICFIAQERTENATENGRKAPEIIYRPPPVSSTIKPSYPSFKELPAIKDHLAHVKSSCKKLSPTDNYTVCDNLPLQPILCGVQADKRHVDGNGAKYRIPNIVHFVRIGDFEFSALTYLALRSVATIQQPEHIYIYYTTQIATGKFAERAMNEIPCLTWIKVEDPKIVDGVELTMPSTRSLIIRFTKLLEQGGIFLDNDVIFLKNVDSLRQFSFVAGRESEESINLGVLLMEQNSPCFSNFYHSGFLSDIQQYYNAKKYFLYPENRILRFYQKNLGNAAGVHFEDNSLARPLPFEAHDGFGATLRGHLDISAHYVLHIHLRTWAVEREPELGSVYTDTEEELRTRDDIYGAAARTAYFGSPDLVFKQGETTFVRKPTIQLFPLSTIGPYKEVEP